MVSDSLSITSATSTNIAELVATSENDSAIVERGLIFELDKKIYSITKGASTSAYFNYFKNMALANIQNANILYDFIITEQNHTNVKLSTRLSYIKVICLFIDIFINYNKSDIVMDSLMFN